MLEIKEFVVSGDATLKRKLHLIIETDTVDEMQEVQKRICAVLAENVDLHDIKRWDPAGKQCYSSIRPPCPRCLHFLTGLVYADKRTVCPRCNKVWQLTDDLTSVIQ